MICRLCLNPNEEQLCSVFENKEILPKIIKQYISIEIMVTDHLPTTVCLECITKIKDWHKFREQCLAVNEMLSRDQQNITLTKDDKLRKSDDSKHESTALIQKNLEGAYNCTVCSKEFEECFEYLDHQHLHNGEAVFQCDKCSEVFSFREKLVEHDAIHNIAIKMPCPECGKLIMESGLKAHLIKHTDKFICTYCKNTFTSKANLDQHIISVHTDIRDYVCETCGKKFSSRKALSLHLKTHITERSHHCLICNYSGKTVASLKDHMYKHSNETCICEICSKTYKSRRLLTAHLRRAHCKNKKHQCHYCGKKFVDTAKLKVHLRYHTGVRPYACEFCDRTFIRSDVLKDHLATHGEREWFECPTCQRKFISKRGFSRHNCPNIKIKPN